MITVTSGTNPIIFVLGRNIKYYLNLEVNVGPSVSGFFAELNSTSIGK